MAAYTAIDDPEAHFQTVIYTGNGSTQSITLPGTTDMLPDMIWFKRRDDTDQPKLHDAVRGVAARLGPNADSAEVSDDDVITSFNSDGFSLGDDDSSNASSASNTISHSSSFNLIVVFAILITQVPSRLEYHNLIELHKLWIVKLA